MSKSKPAPQPWRPGEAHETMATIVAAIVRDRLGVADQDTAPVFDEAEFSRLSQEQYSRMAVIEAEGHSLRARVAELESRDVVEVTEEMRKNLDAVLRDGVSRDSLRAARDVVEEIKTQRAARAKERMTWPEV